MGWRVFYFALSIGGAGILIWIFSFFIYSDVFYRVFSIAKFLHKLLGKLLIAFSIATMFKGLLDYNGGKLVLSVILVIIHWSSYLIAIMVLEIFH